MSCIPLLFGSWLVIISMMATKKRQKNVIALEWRVKWRREFIHKIIYFPLFGQEKSLIASPFCWSREIFLLTAGRERFEKYYAAFLFRAPPSAAKYIYTNNNNAQSRLQLLAAGELLLRAKQFAKHIENGRARAGRVTLLMFPLLWRKKEKRVAAHPIKKIC